MVEVPYLVATEDVSATEICCPNCHSGLVAEWGYCGIQEDYAGYEEACPSCGTLIHYGAKNGKAYPAE